MIFTVEVGAATSRPPRCHELHVVEVEAGTEQEAQLVAAQMVACRPGVTMPVHTRVLDVDEL